MKAQLWLDLASFVVISSGFYLGVKLLLKKTFKKPDKTRRNRAVLDDLEDDASWEIASRTCAKPTATESETSKLLSRRRFLPRIAFGVLAFFAGSSLRAADLKHVEGARDFLADAKGLDGGHTDTHSDAPHSDSHSDTGNPRAKKSPNQELAAGDHTDTHSDRAAIDSHTDSPEKHVDVASEVGHADFMRPHMDSHMDAPHNDTHTDQSHIDVPHNDNALVA
ncbi:MAG TPA: hypothetical protein VMH87_05530 [Pseudomonadales bacterium]|nr:hypothetical protein [Pseudomonadales bacterium]